MPGPPLPVIKMKHSEASQKLASTLFGESEVKNKIAMSAVKMIIGDIVTLYNEFKTAEGAGALLFNPQFPEKSQYMALRDIQRDLALAEELMDTDLQKFLQKVQTIVVKESSTEKPIVVMITSESMSVHVIDLNETEERLKEAYDASKYL